MTTQAVLFTVPTPAWTGTVDVTDANLLTDVTVTDFNLFYNGAEQGTVEKALWVKTSPVQLTYSGSALTTNDVVTIRRKTPNTVVQTVTPQSIILSSLWNSEFDRQIRWREESDLFHHTSTVGTGLVDNTTYGVSWNGVTLDAPSKNAVYDGITDLLTNSVTLTGSVVATSATVTVATPTTPTQAANKSYVDSVSRVFEARISLSSTLPVCPGVTSSTLYLQPYKGNRVSLYDGSKWVLFNLTTGATSLALSGLTGDLPYDVYVYSNAGTLTLSLTAWTNTSTRATALTTQDGVYVKTGATGYRYCGTMTPHAANSCKVSGNIDQTYNAGFQTSISYQGICNYYNRLPISLVKNDYAGDGQNLENAVEASTTNAAQLLYNADCPNHSKFGITSCGLSEFVDAYSYSLLWYPSTATTDPWLICLVNSWTTGEEPLTSSVKLGTTRSQSYTSSALVHVYNSVFGGADIGFYKAALTVKPTTNYVTKLLNQCLHTVQSCY